jgi:hypothetical protein
MEESLSPVVPSPGRNPGTPWDRSTTRHSEEKPASSALKRCKDVRSQLRNPLRFSDGEAPADVERLLTRQVSHQRDCLLRLWAFDPLRHVGSRFGYKSRGTGGMHFEVESRQTPDPLGAADKDIQAILRHSNISITMNIYLKSTGRSQAHAMDLLGEEFEKQQIGHLSR